MVIKELICVMEASQCDGSSGSYSVHRKGSSYSITAPSGHKSSYQGAEINIDNVKSQIELAFNVVVTKITQ